MAGRKGKYETHILPRFDDIDKWLNEGATEKNIAKRLKVAYSSWNNYKNDYPEFKALLDKPREGLVANLRGALVKKALGFTYEEKKTYIKEEVDPVSGQKTGKRYMYTEIVKRESLPDTTAIFGALNIYDPEYVRDRATYDLRQQELELRKKMMEEKDW